LAAEQSKSTFSTRRAGPVRLTRETAPCPTPSPC
jgi:hypothetical protein